MEFVFLLVLIKNHQYRSMDYASQRILSWNIDVAEQCKFIVRTEGRFLFHFIHETATKVDSWIYLEG